MRLRSWLNTSGTVDPGLSEDIFESKFNRLTFCWVDDFCYQVFTYSLCPLCLCGSFLSFRKDELNHRDTEGTEEESNACFNGDLAFLSNKRCFILAHS